MAFLPCGDPRAQQGWSLVRPSYNPPTSVGNVDVIARTGESPPKTSFGCRKGGAWFCMGQRRPAAGADKHASLPSGSRRNTSVLQPMQDGAWVRACVGFFRTVSPETRALSLSRREHGLSCEFALAYVQKRASVPAKIGEFMRHLRRVSGWRVCCSPCAHHLACKKSNNAEEA